MLFLEIASVTTYFREKKKENHTTFLRENLSALFVYGLFKNNQPKNKRPHWSGRQSESTGMSELFAPDNPIQNIKTVILE